MVPRILVFEQQSISHFDAWPQRRLPGQLENVKMGYWDFGKPRRLEPSNEVLNAACGCRASINPSTDSAYQIRIPKSRSFDYLKVLPAVHITHPFRGQLSASNKTL
jgi:hypothetical protein